MEQSSGQIRTQRQHRSKRRTPHRLDRSTNGICGETTRTKTLSAPTQTTPKSRHKNIRGKIKNGHAEGRYHPKYRQTGTFFLSLFCSRRGNRAKTEYQAENEKMNKTQTNLHSTNDSPNPLARTRGAKINIYAHAKNDHARTQKQR